MLERGLDVDHTTLYRWVQHYAPEMEKRLRWYWKPSIGYSWRVDGTYVKVKGKWAYLYRAIDKRGHTIDFYLSATRNTQAENSLRHHQRFRAHADVQERTAGHVEIGPRLTGEILLIERLFGIYSA